MIIKKLFILVILAMTLFLLGYFLILVLRTSFLELSTYLGNDVIIGFHSISAITILLTLIALKFRLGFRKLLIVVLVCVLFIEIIFITLYFNDKISVYTKSEKEIMLKQKSIQLPINTEEKAWSAIHKYLLVQSCISYYEFEKKAEDIGKYWLLTVKDKNPNKLSSCNSTKVLVSKHNGQLTHLNE